MAVARLACYPSHREGGMAPGSRLNQSALDQLLNNPKLLFGILGTTGLGLLAAWVLTSSTPKKPQETRAKAVQIARRPAQKFVDPRALKPGESHFGVKKGNFPMGSMVADAPAKGVKPAPASRDSSASDMMAEMRRRAAGPSQVHAPPDSVALAEAGLTAGADRSNPSTVSGGFGNFSDEAPDTGPIEHRDRAAAVATAAKIARAGGGVGRTFSGRNKAVGAAPRGGSLARGSSPASQATFSSTAGGGTTALPGAIGGPPSGSASSAGPAAVQAPRISAGSAIGHDASGGGGGEGGERGDLPYDSQSSQANAPKPLTRGQIRTVAKEDYKVAEAYRSGAVNKLITYVAQESRGLMTDGTSAETRLQRASRWLTSAKRKYITFSRVHQKLAELKTTIDDDLRGGLASASSGIAGGRRVLVALPKSCGSPRRGNRRISKADVANGLRDIGAGVVALRGLREAVSLTGDAVDEEFPPLAGDIDAVSKPLGDEFRKLARDLSRVIGEAATDLPAGQGVHAPPRKADDIKKALRKGSRNFQERNVLFKRRHQRYPQIGALSTAQDRMTRAVQRADFAMARGGFISQSFDASIQTGRHSVLAYLDVCSVASIKERTLAPRAPKK
jgi:hypothetical protein